MPAEANVRHFALKVPPSGEAYPPVDVRAPFDGRLLATVDVCGWPEVDAALDIAHSLFRDRDAWLPSARRIAILRRAAQLVEERAEELALEAAAEGGKPLADS